MKLSSDMHFVRKHILRYLMVHDTARFRDMRPSRVDSNLYAYHLKQLQKDGFVSLFDGLYTLSPGGMRYADHLSLASTEPRWQPKIITKLVIQNSWGEVLMWPKYRQPFLGLWSLPTGKVHYEDKSLREASLRELTFITKSPDIDPIHRGVLELRASIKGEVVSHVLIHIFTLQLESNEVFHELAHWKDVTELIPTQCSPGTLESLRLVAANDDFFYELHSEDR